MKTLIALILLISSSAYAYTPEHELVISDDKTVTLTVKADSWDYTSVCSYKMSWFDGLSYKRYFGNFKMYADDVKNFEVKNDINSRITFPSASVECLYTR